MKKLMMMAVILLAGVGSVMAQSDYKRGIFNHVGLNVGAGTEGISVGVAAPVTNFLEVEAGVNIMPSFKLSGDLDVDVSTSSLPLNYLMLLIQPVQPFMQKAHLTVPPLM